MISGLFPDEIWKFRGDRLALFPPGCQILPFPRCNVPSRPELGTMRAVSVIKLSLRTEKIYVCTLLSPGNRR